MVYLFKFLVDGIFYKVGRSHVSKTPLSHEVT